MELLMGSLTGQMHMQMDHTKSVCVLVNCEHTFHTFLKKINQCTVSKCSTILPQRCGSLKWFLLTEWYELPVNYFPFSIENKNF